MLAQRHHPARGKHPRVRMTGDGIPSVNPLEIRNPFRFELIPTSRFSVRGAGENLDTTTNNNKQL